MRFECQTKLDEKATTSLRVYSGEYERRKIMHNMCDVISMLKQLRNSIEFVRNFYFEWIEMEAIQHTRSLKFKSLIHCIYDCDCAIY